MSLKLNCANVYEGEGSKIQIPPENAKSYSTGIDPKSLKEEIKKGANAIELPLIEGEKTKKQDGAIEK